MPPMKKVILVSRDKQGDFTDWEIVYLIKEHVNVWHIWSLSHLFGMWVHKRSIGYKVEEL